MIASELICPVCQQPTTEAARTLRCVAGHSYDVAREGYVNLVTGKAPGALQGDSAAMVTARRAFLARGFYQPLAEAIATAVGDVKPQVVADFGCGEGYYLHEVTRNIASVRAYGTDISKPAVAAAAKVYREAQFVVADTNRFIPLASGSVDAAINVFAPRNAAEFGRVMRPGGRLVVAIPGAEHLASLRERFGLIGIEEDKAVKIAAQLAEHFELKQTQHVDCAIELDGAAATDLLEMTPNARHIDSNTLADIHEGELIMTSAHFEVLVFTRR